jgi:hypothetical protein
MVLRVAGKFVVPLLLISLIIYMRPVSATVGQGSIELAFRYGSVSGELVNATLFANNTVAIKMVINDLLKTSYGPLPLTATGLWNGVKDGQEVSGSISNVVGQVSVRGDFFEFDANGVFAGSLNGSHCEGSFNGTLTFTSSPYPNIPINQPFPMTGTWSTDFATP